MQLHGKYAWVTLTILLTRLSELHQCDQEMLPSTLILKAIEERFFSYIGNLFFQKTYIIIWLHSWYFYLNNKKKMPAHMLLHH